MKYLVIVESPAKCKIIEKYLKEVDKQNAYTVVASYGHIRDLEKKALGIDIEHGFEPTYVIMLDKQDKVKALRAAAQSSDCVLLASDNDREGESIAWHVKETLRLKQGQFKRMTFNEITKTAMQDAINRLGKIDMNLVNAQQSRRIIDRIMGFKLSPMLWAHFKVEGQGFTPLSAGRVQSAALKIIIDKEREIRQHKSVAYWTIKGCFKLGADMINDVKLNHTQVGKTQPSEPNDPDSGDDKGVKRFVSPEEVEGFFNKLVNHFTINSHSRKNVKEAPPAPFITSTLQQEAHNKLGIDVKTTMAMAQKLYEAGYITYMRTDSYNLSEHALINIESYVTKTYGLEYHELRQFNKRKVKNSQEAHEAIRPTNCFTPYDEVASKFDAKHAKLYDLILKRAVACQMKSAVYAELHLHITSELLHKLKLEFLGKVKLLEFVGWLVVYGQRMASLSNMNQLNKLLDKSQVQPVCVGMTAKNTWTSAPAHYNESSLVKVLEKEGIGRPSTYAAIITKLYDKQYIIKQNSQGEEHGTIDYIWTPDTGKVVASKGCVRTNAESGRIVSNVLGERVNEYLEQNFADMIDAAFTASMEEKLDEVATGSEKHINVLRQFWSQLRTRIEEVTKHTPQQKTRIETSNVVQHVIDGIEHTVRIAKYGPVIEHINSAGEKKYIGLDPYLKIVNKAYTEIDKNDIMFLTTLPMPLKHVPHARLNYARYGFYISLHDSDGKVTENVSLFPGWIAKHISDVTTELVNLDTKTIEDLRQFKAARGATTTTKAKESKRPTTSHSKSSGKNKHLAQRATKPRSTVLGNGGRKKNTDVV